MIHVGDQSLRRLCELSTGTVLTPGQLVPLVTEADIQRIVYEGKSRRITDLGERSRLFTGPLRQAILWRDRHCQHPGCRVPAEHCEVDHVMPWSKGGLTTQENGKAGCASHNRHKADTLPEDYPGYADQRPPLFDTRNGSKDTDDYPGSGKHPDQPRPLSGRDDHPDQRPQLDTNHQDKDAAQRPPPRSDDGDPRPLLDTG